MEIELLELLDKEIELKNTESVYKIIDNLIAMKSDWVYSKFINMIDSSKPSIRNYGALALKDLNDDRAVNHLIRNILKSENRNNNGTMVYALEDLDCSENISSIYKVLFFESYEAKIHASVILNSQEFVVSEEDEYSIRSDYNKYLKSDQTNDEDTDSAIRRHYQDFEDYLSAT